MRGASLEMVFIIFIYNFIYNFSAHPCASHEYHGGAKF